MSTISKLMTGGRLPLANALFAAVVYLTTMAPTISHTDSGELAAVCFTGGVAHPTGYPLFTVLGWLWTRIPIVSPALQLNFLCLLFVAGGVYFFSRSLQLFFSKWRTKIKDAEDGGKALLEKAHLFANTTGSLTLAFSHTFWMQSTSVEVYSLHILLLCLNLFLLLRAWYAPKKAVRPWLFLAGGLALAFANHLSFFTFLPAIAWLFFAKFGFAENPRVSIATWITFIIRFLFNKTSAARLAAMLGVFIPLLALQYLYLPLRAGVDPHLNWGDPDSWAEFWHHFSGRQFRVWMFTGFDAFKEDLGAFLQRLPGEFMYLPLALAIPGIWYGAKFRKHVSGALVGAILLNVIYAANYHIKDPEPYFLPTFMALAFFMAIGVRYLWVRMRMPDSLRAGLAGLTVVCIALPLAGHHGSVNQRDARQFEQYARAALESLPENALVISKHWDGFVSPAYYLQEVEGFRTDVDIVEYQMLHDRHWYPEHLRANAPEVAERIKADLDAWDEVVGEFDLEGIMDPRKLGQGLMKVFYGIMEEEKRRPVYLGPEIYPGAMGADRFPMPDQLTLVPEAFFMRIIPAGNVSQYIPLPQSTTDIDLPPVDERDPETVTLVLAWGDVVAQRAVYELVFNKKEEAIRLKDWLKEMDPDRVLPRALESI